MEKIGIKLFDFASSNWPFQIGLFSALALSTVCFIHVFGFVTIYTTYWSAPSLIVVFILIYIFWHKTSLPRVPDGKVEGGRNW